MWTFYRKTAKELLELRNKIVLETAIPCLEEIGFSKSPFSTAWNGRNNLKDFDYQLCRLTANSRIEIIHIYVARGERRIKFILNIFDLEPKIEMIQQLVGVDGLQFHLPPNSVTEMQLRSDEIKGPPIFNINYMSGHELKSFYTK